MIFLNGKVGKIGKVSGRDYFFPIFPTFLFKNLP